MDLPHFDDNENPLGKNPNVKVDRYSDEDAYSELGSQGSRQAVQKHKALALNKETKPLEENNDDDKSDITEVTENKTPRKKKKCLSHSEIKSQLKIAMVQLARSKFQ
eukprot:6723241-Ditylum_brightwellii.AAC.1